MKSFVTSQFNYFPLTWMFHNITLNNKINKLHERALRVVHKDINLSFQDLLDLDNSMTIHHWNIQKLAIEMYRIKNKLSPIPMMDIFKDHVNTYDLRNKRCWETVKVRTVSYGTETIRSRDPKPWGMVLHHINDSKTFSEFKSKINVDCVKHLFQN